MAAKQKVALDEKVMTGGGQTGQSIGPDASGVKKAQAPGNSKTQGDLASQKLEGDMEETDSENNTKPTGDASAKNKASVSMKEDVDAMFDGQELSEEFKERAAVVFEAAVGARVEATKAELEEQYNDAFEQAKQDIEQEVSAKVDEYLAYVVEQWMEENKVAVESSLRSEITEEFMADLKQLFVEHNIELPEDKIDVVEELAARVEELEGKLNDQINENLELKKITNEVEKQSIFVKVAEGLAATQIEKFESLSEGVIFDDVATYEKKLTLIKENYFPVDKKPTQMIAEQVDDEQAEEVQALSGPMAHYSKAIGRTIKK